MEPESSTWRGLTDLALDAAIAVVACAAYTVIVVIAVGARPFTRREPRLRLDDSTLERVMDDWTADELRRGPDQSGRW